VIVTRMNLKMARSWIARRGCGRLTLYLIIVNIAASPFSPLD